jgi:Cu-Zn family superoxide dismutase
MRRLLLLLPVLLAACGPKTESLGRVGGAPPSLMLASKLLTADGNALGDAELLQLEQGTQVIVAVKGLPAGQYAVHIHAVGRCTAPDFASAGPHFNPAGRQHGKDNPMGSHAGDLPNLVVDAKGVGSLNEIVPGLRLADGAAPVLDGDGAAIVVHAKPDDYRTDPAGNAGTRFACAEFRRG